MDPPTQLYLYFCKVDLHPESTHSHQYGNKRFENLFVTIPLQKKMVASRWSNRHPEIQKQTLLDISQLLKIKWNKAVIMKLFKSLTSQRISENNIEPKICTKPLLLLSYLDDDIMNWSRQWACRSRGVTLPFDDLKRTLQDNDRLLNHSALHPYTHYMYVSLPYSYI